MKTVNDFLRETYNLMAIPRGSGRTAYVVKLGLTIIRYRMTCADGFQVSVQASSGHYCTPRKTFAGPYETIELGYPTEKEDLIIKYAETPDSPCDTIYAEVPVEVVDVMIKKHGGIVDELWRYNLASMD